MPSTRTTGPVDGSEPVDADRPTSNGPAPATPATTETAGSTASTGSAAPDAATAAPVVAPEEPPVDVTDIPAVRVHHPGDLLSAIGSLLGTGVLMLAAIYAQHTASGVAEDVQGFATLLQRILFVPVSVLASVVTMVGPIAVLAELAVRRQGRRLLLALAAGFGATGVAVLVSWVIVTTGAKELERGLSVWVSGSWELTIPAFVAMLAGLLTVAGPHGRRRSVGWTWNLLWVVLGVMVVTAQVSLPGVGVALLLGRAVGLYVRYLGGVEPEQAYGQRLVAGVRRAGFDPSSLVRVPDAATASAGQALPPADPTSLALARSTGSRVYALETTDGRRLDLLVMDGDRQVVGMLQRTWRSIRLRGIDGRRVVSLRQAAERAALLAYAAASARVRMPRLLSVAEVDDSMLLVVEHPAGAVPLSELADAEVDDRLLVDVWAQLRRAHAAGVAHRALTSDVVLVGTGEDGSSAVWLTGWENGDVASSELARRIDATQLLALLSLRVGPYRALESASRVLAAEEIAALGPLLQTITLPRRTREEMRRNRTVLAELRTALVARIPEADVEPQQLVRFGARTVITVLLTAVAVVVILASINVQQIGQALSESDWRWGLVSFGLGLVTLVGGALALVAFSPVKVPLWRATLVQTAATFVALAAPAGIGPAALNLRTLTRRGASTTVAAATVALVQVSQLVVTLIMLLTLSVLPGGSSESLTVSPTMLIVLGAVAVLVGVALLVPKVRAWVVAKVRPTLRQTWPRLVEVLGQPLRLALGLAGNLVMTLGYVLAFDAALLAFGQHVDLVQVAVVYLAGNTAGALVPTPGGVGTVEAALTAGLTGIGLNPGVAAAVAVLFRVATYWLRIPLGWVSMRVLQRSGEL
ncbi:lysylphosphatidylglycerol synthase transmembrane domain-containing protein [Cellulomonas citrea]|uniref:lysylphosphatidylglycerol synthase transmembrane domain-containing protein n=1 Tax=Cellulomonas citrea TaxID=1909423 RepID=UPI00135B5512|nr:lysylphosphatidylglycerol synthase transmembrane domain-containing protein [Cellulomonas citrea]